MIRRSHPLLIAFVTLAVMARALRAQAGPAPLTRAEAVEMALARGARLGAARADTAVARAQLATARAFENPTASASYSKSAPQQHYALDVPLDYPWLRSARVGAARTGMLAAQYRFRFARAAIALDVDTTYTRTLATRERARLSQRNAADADSLLRMAIARRDAGDASDLDVALATVNAGQQANLAASDSFTFLSTLLDLQAAIGLAADFVAVMPTDSLTLPPLDSIAGDGQLASPTLQVAAAEAAFRSAVLSTRFARRNVFGAPSLTAGFETHDPGEPGMLPTFGVALPLPILNWNRGPILQAQAERDRARAELALATVESRTQVLRAVRARSVALAKVRRDVNLVESARRVAAMSLTAYREGASPIATVLEAQRNARDVIAQYVDDLAEAWIAIATLRVLTLTPANTP